MTQDPNTLADKLEAGSHLLRNRLEDHELRIILAILRSQPAQASDEARRLFKLRDTVTKKTGANWTGKVVGFYSTDLTPIGYAVESENESGSVQIYPENALERSPARPQASDEAVPTDEEIRDEAHKRFLEAEKTPGYYDYCLIAATRDTSWFKPAPEVDWAARICNEFRSWGQACPDLVRLSRINAILEEYTKALAKRDAVAVPAWMIEPNLVEALNGLLEIRPDNWKDLRDDDPEQFKAWQSAEKALAGIPLPKPVFSEEIIAIAMNAQASVLPSNYVSYDQVARALAQAILSLPSTKHPADVAADARHILFCTAKP